MDTSKHRYGCYNRPRPAPGDTYVAQTGWGPIFRDGFGAPCRTPIYRDVPSTFGTTECQYDKSATDVACAGCIHAKQTVSAVPTDLSAKVLETIYLECQRGTSAERLHKAVMAAVSAGAVLTFDEWLKFDEKKDGCRGLSRLEVDQMRDAFEAGRATLPPSAGAPTQQQLEDARGEGWLEGAGMMAKAYLEDIGSAGAPVSGAGQAGAAQTDANSPQTRMDAQSKPLLADGQELPAHEDFAAWLAREMPAGTVIADPAWWAPRILRAALAMRQPQGDDALREHLARVFDAMPAHEVLRGSQIAGQIRAAKQAGKETQ